MGILDDAIREHLDLKRRTGAADDELKQLEDEAFGLPTRPGEPDFPTPETAVAEEGPRAEVTEAPSEEIPPGEQWTAVQTTGEQPAAEAVDEWAHAAEAPSDELALDEEPAVAEDDPLADAGEDAVAQPAPIFDRSVEDELDLDLDLEDEDLPGLEDEVPVESLETVEHPMHEVGEAEQEDEELDGRQELEPAPGEEASTAPAPPNAESEAPAEPPTGEEELGEEQDAESEEDEDVLADTPEFLRDRPEDDELWFEQGEPKDFDFD